MKRNITVGKLVLSILFLLLLTIFLCYSIYSVFKDALLIVFSLILGVACGLLFAMFWLTREKFGKIRNANISKKNRKFSPWNSAGVGLLLVYLVKFGIIDGSWIAILGGLAIAFSAALLIIAVKEVYYIQS